MEPHEQSRRARRGRAFPLEGWASPLDAIPLSPAGYKEKMALPRARAAVTSRLRVAAPFWRPRLGSGISTGFPFAASPAVKGGRFKPFRDALRSDSLGSYRTSPETFLHFSPQGSHLCSRYFHQDLH
jgi:hypothetical protein